MLMTHKAVIGFRYGSTVYKPGDLVTVHAADLPLLTANGYIKAEAPKRRTKKQKAEG